MIIGGFQKFSLIDYPGRICAIVFTQGCNFRCPYCHNPELVETKRAGQEGFKEDEILAFLKRRKGKLDAVTITGGEPCLHKDLLKFLSAAKGLGYLIKLDTNGSFPSALASIITSHCVDYLAMDIKTAPDKYEQVVRKRIETDKILESIRLIMDSGLDYEFRTTVVPGLFEEDDFPAMGRSIKNARLYALQRFVPSKTLDPQFLHVQSCPYEELNRLKEIMGGYVHKCVVR